jgi:hypothetical protein
MNHKHITIMSTVITFTENYNTKPNHYEAIMYNVYLAEKKMKEAISDMAYEAAEDVKKHWAEVASYIVTEAEADVKLAEENEIMSITDTWKGVITVTFKGGLYTAHDNDGDVLFWEDEKDREMFILRLADEYRIEIA